MTKHRRAPAELSGPVVTSESGFTYPKQAFRRVRAFYARRGDEQMVDILSHDMGRFERIKRKIEHEREMTDE